jgi:hypothetical protein
VLKKEAERRHERAESADDSFDELLRKELRRKGLVPAGPQP